MADAPFADRAELLFEVMPGVLEYVWRRHLEVEARRRLAQLEGSAPRARAPPWSSGFADLVGFTALSQQIPEDELAHVVGRFEAVAADVVSVHGGRLVKTIGDEVMFSADDVGRRRRDRPRACPSSSARRRSCPTSGSAWPTARSCSTRATSTGRS